MSWNGEKVVKAMVHEGFFFSATCKATNAALQVTKTNICRIAEGVCWSIRNVKFINESFYNMRCLVVYNRSLFVILNLIIFVTNCYYTCDLYYICDQLLHLCLQQHPIIAACNATNIAWRVARKVEVAACDIPSATWHAILWKWANRSASFRLTGDFEIRISNGYVASCEQKLQACAGHPLCNLLCFRSSSLRCKLNFSCNLAFSNLAFDIS